MSQTIVTTFCFNDAEYPFDVRDADDAEKMEVATENMQAAEKQLPKDGKTSVILKSHCTLIKNYFNDIFGENAGIKICGERNNLDAHYEAYDAFLNLVRVQKDALVTRGNSYKKYSNREQRRHPEATKK